MASITSMMNSSYNTSSIYGTRNVLSGLASGMDTETMIENAVSGIKMKIQNLLKRRTKVEWQQEAYRSIIDKAVNFNTKYTSYASKTNLLSSSFFNNAVITTAKGTYADKITATGKTSSNIKINAVKQMATAASYTVSGSSVFDGDFSSVTGKEFDIDSTIPVSTVAGSLTFQYGGSNGTSFDIRFDELENVNEVKVYNADGSEKTDATDTERLMQAIKNKLSEISYTYKQNGVQETVTADKAIKLEIDPDGDIIFSDGLGNGNTVKISSSSGSLKYLAGADFIGGIGDEGLIKDFDLKEYLEDMTLGLTYNGASKTINLTDVLKKIDPNSEKDSNTQFVQALQDELDKAFGKGKIEVSHGGEGGGLSFTPKGKGDTLSLGGSAVKALGFESGDSNYINTSKKLEDLLGEDFDWEKYRTEDKDGKAAYDFEINGAHIKVTKNTTLESLLSSINSNADAGVKVSYSRLTNEFQFTATETGANSRIDFGGVAEALFGSPASIRSMSSQDSFAERFGIDWEGEGDQFVAMVSPEGTAGFWISKDTTIDEAIAKANKLFSWVEAELSYDKQSNQIILKDRDGNQVDYRLALGKDAYTKEEDYVYVEYTPPVGRYTAGTDAIMDVEINGVRFENLSRSGNTFDIDGMSVTVKGTFDEKSVEEGKDYEPVTFETVTDSDKIIDVIRSFVNDYNEMVTELKGAYSTMPGRQTDGSRYEPLTAEQEEGMTESEIKAYEEKAKQGILFGDTTLSGMYSKLLNAIAPGGADGQTLREIGIGTSYENGLTTLSLNEDKLRATLDSNLDKVKDAFAKTKENGSSSDGLMQTLQNTLNTYVKTTGEPKGVLITRAGSIKAPTSLNNNSLNSQISGIDREIERWQTKMSKQIDRYTSQFSRLEQLIAAMNSQASAMSGLMGGYEGY